jgi:flagellar hook-basal body complex protein FliE
MESIHFQQNVDRKIADPKQTTPAQAQQSFAKTLNEMIHKVNDSQVQSNKATQELINGDTSNLHGVMIQAEKASITLQTAVEVRNKVIESYKEMMRMQL